MTSRKTTWTAQQKAAISTTGSQVLVTASAGTGKTAVLSARCAQLLADPENAAQASQLLVLTFTEAAAAEMKSRIAKAIKEKYSSLPDPHLRRQMLLLDSADISTIDSFCKKIVTENFHQLSIDPTFRIIDPDEQQLLKSEILKDILTEACEDQSLCAAVYDLFNCRQLDGKSNFSQSIVRIHDYLDGICWRNEWFVKSRAIISSAVSAGPLADAQKTLLQKKLDDILDQLRHSCLLDGALNAAKWASQIETDYLPAVQSCLNSLKKNDLRSCGEVITAFEKSKWARRDKSFDESIADLIKAPADKALKDFKALAQLASLNPRYAQMIAASETRHTLTLIELVSRFALRYAERKSQLNCLDFADLEQNALKLLVTRTGQNISPSPLALKLRDRYHYVLVDEFQDISMVQESIIQSICRPDNLFIVGDVKQSIYSWRQAQPEIFINRLRLASPFTSPASDSPISIPLTSNFRSRPEILEFVNIVFEKIMTASFTGMDYDKSARLEAGSEHKPLADLSLDGCTQKAIDLHLLIDNLQLDDEESASAPPSADIEKTTARQRQAQLIADIIKNMVTGSNGGARFQITDKNSKLLRPVEYRDIVILMRGLSKTAGEYAQLLRMNSIPVSTQAAMGYFEATEITDCIILLSVLDNPQKDIDFAAILRGPFFRVTDSQLAHIRVFARQTSPDLDFYNAFKLYCSSGPDIQLREKFSQIDTTLESWRTWARTGSIADMLWNIFTTRDFIAFVSALPNGSQRRANVLKFHQRAVEFENFVSSSRSLTLSRFIEYIHKLLEEGQDWSPAPPDSSAQNAVQIMSVHKSKGLEFPVVILAELNTKFNQSDTSDQCLMDADLGLGLKIIPPRTRQPVSGIAHQVIREKKKAQTLAEEMRVLYVAMTRARERLILIGSASSSELNKCVYNGALVPSALPTWMLASCDKPLKWLLYGLADQQTILKAFAPQLDVPSRKDDLFSLNVHGPDDILSLSQKIETLRTASRSVSAIEPARNDPRARELLDRFRSSLQWQYPFANASRIQAKTSVSEFLRKQNDSQPAESSQLLLNDWPGLDPDCADRCQFPALVGTATHLLFQHLDISQPPAGEMVSSTLARLVETAAISPRIARLINIDGILAFFQSPPGQMLFDKQNTVYRELPFTSAMDAPDLKNEKIVVQGIIDLLIRTPNGLVLVDFKTDNVSAAIAKTRAAAYGPQLELYSRAASAAFNAKMLAAYLYFITPAACVQLG